MFNATIQLLVTLETLFWRVIIGYIVIKTALFCYLYLPAIPYLGF